MRSFISQLGIVKRTSERLTRERIAREARNREAAMRERNELISACTITQLFEKNFVITEEDEEVIIDPAKKPETEIKDVPLDPKVFKILVFGNEKFEDVEL